MNIPEVDSTIAVCKNFLDSSDGRGTEIESFLTRYVLIRVSANFEQVVRKLMTERLRNTSDSYVIALAEHGISHVFQGSKTSALAKMLGRIDPSLKDSFCSKVNGSPKETSYNLLVIDRNRTAHDTATSLSFSDLEMHYNLAHQVLDDIRDAIAGQDDAPENHANP